MILDELYASTRRFLLVFFVIVFINALVFGVSTFVFNDNDSTTTASVRGNPIMEPLTSITGPAITTLSLDSSRLIFGEIDDKLVIIPVTSPYQARVYNISFSSSNEEVAKIDNNGLVTAVGFGECYVTATYYDKTASCKVSVADKWVAFTFDDGPGKPTQILLDELKKRDVRATFFIVGQNAKSEYGQEMLKRMYYEGHEIGNHTYKHTHSKDKVKKGAKQTDKLVEKATGKPTVLFRPPEGRINKKTKKLGKPLILWSIDPLDWKERKVKKVKKNILKDVKSGDIVLLHDLYPTSVKGGLQAIDNLQSKGYTFVTVSEMLDNPKNGERYRMGSPIVTTKKILR